MKRVLLAGQTGLVGGELLALLLADERVEHVTSLVRRATSLSAPKLVQQPFDFATGVVEGAFDTAYIALGTTMKKAGSKEAFRAVDFDAVVHVAKAARAAGATSVVVVSSVGADRGSSNFYLQVKGEMEDAVTALGFARTVFLRPSILLGKRAEDRPGERFAAAITRFARPAIAGPFAKYKPVEATLVAKAAVGLAEGAEVAVIAHYADLAKFA